MALSDIDDLENDPIEGEYQVTYHGQIHRGMKSLKTLEQDTDAAVMKTSGTQTIAGIKTFSSSPIVPTPISGTDIANKEYADTGASGKEPAISAGTSAQYYRGDKTWQTLNATSAGLGNVNNTSDANKPVSTAQQAALNLKQDYLYVNLLNNGGAELGLWGWTVNGAITQSSDYARTGTYSFKYTGGTGLGEAMGEAVPVSDGQVVRVEGYVYHPALTTGQGIRVQAQRISDDAWIQIHAGSANQIGSWQYFLFTYTVDGSVYDHVRVRLGFNSPNTAYVDDLTMRIDGVASTSQYFNGSKTFQRLDKAAVGLENVDNTSDANKPVSTATQTELDLKQSSISTGETYQYFRGDKSWQTLDKSAAGLGNVDNTSDSAKPVSSATQTALNLKANSADTMLLTGAQTIAGIKTFSSSPKVGGTTTIGYVWKSTSADGSGSWQEIGPLVTTVDWDNIPDKPTTFDPTIGTTSTTAAAGDHSHTKSDIGLGNVDNTSDLAKPISTATQSELNTKVATSRTLSTSSHFTGGGDMSSDRTYAFASGGIGLADMASSTKTTGIAYVQTLDTRAVGLGQLEDGFEFPFAATVTSVKYRMGTADASGTTTCEIRKNGAAVSGTSGTASTSPSAVTGSWSFSAGDKLTIYTTAIGTTPGKRLTADMIIIMA